MQLSVTSLALHSSFCWSTQSLKASPHCVNSTLMMYCRDKEVSQSPNDRLRPQPLEGKCKRSSFGSSSCVVSRAKAEIVRKRSTYLPRELLELPLHREVPLQHIWPSVQCPLEDLLDGERLVERHGEVLDLRGQDHAFGAVGHVSQVPGGDGVPGGTVGADLNGEKVVGLTLALELGGELGLGDALRLRSGYRLVSWLHLCNFSLKMTRN